MTTEDRVKRIIALQVGCDENEVTPGANFQDDLGADLLDVVELVMTFEEEFDLEIDDEDAEKMVTVKAVLDYLSTRVK